MPADYSTDGLASLTERPAYRRREPQHERVCDMCGATFRTHYPRAKRCSWECREEYGRLRSLISRSEP